MKFLSNPTAVLTTIVSVCQRPRLRCQDPRNAFISACFQFSQYGNDRKKNLWLNLGSFTVLLLVTSGESSTFLMMRWCISCFDEILKKARLQGFICQIRFLKVCTRDWELVPERFHAAWWRCASSDCRKAPKEAKCTEVSTCRHNVCLESKIQYRIEFLGSMDFHPIHPWFFLVARSVWWLCQLLWRQVRLTWSIMFSMGKMLCITLRSKVEVVDGHCAQVRVPGRSVLLSVSWMFQECLVITSRKCLTWFKFSWVAS